MLRARYWRIVRFFGGVFFSIGFWDILLPRFGFKTLAERTRPERLRRIAGSFRQLAIRMGGVMIKIGQFMSTRVDVLPEEITLELADLQDEVPAEAFEDIRKVAEADLGTTLEQRFFSFEPQPTAAASLGQVHLARLQAESPNDFVIVKVQRPDIEVIIATDLAALRVVGKWVQRYPPIRRRANVPLLIDEFARTLGEEIDYLAEGRNVETFADHFRDRIGVCVPKVIWSHTTQRVLTLEDVKGIKINDYEAITAAGIDRHAVAARLLDIYFKQIFEDGFFHADPHPGNLFIKPLGPGPDGTEQWELTLVDFGMVGQILPDTRHGLRELMIGFGTRDSARIVRAYQMLGMLLPGSNTELLEKATARTFERFYGKNMSELKEISHEEVREFVGEFRELIYEMPFQVPQNLIFLGRAVGLLSGLCTGLDPKFNFWELMAPYAQHLVLQETGSSFPGISSLLSGWLSEAGNFTQKLLSLPRRAEALLDRVERGELVVRDQQLAEQVRRLSLAIHRLSGALIFGILLVSSIQLVLAGQIWPAGLLGIISLLVLLWVIFWL